MERRAGDGRLAAIFWDNDGVLVDTEGLYFEATRAVLANVGVTLDEARYIDLGLRQGRSAFDLVADRSAVDALRAARNTRYSEMLHAGIAAIDGIDETLACLHGSLVMGIVTSSNRDHFELMHGHTGLLRYFDFWLANDAYPRTKPHPDGYLAALQHCGLRPEQCLVVEDSERGLTAARAAGLRCVAIPSGMTRGGEFRGAHAVLESVRELPDVIAALR